MSYVLLKMYFLASFYHQVSSINSGNTASEGGGDRLTPTLAHHLSYVLCVLPAPLKTTIIIIKSKKCWVKNVDGFISLSFKQRVLRMRRVDLICRSKESPQQSCTQRRNAALSLPLPLPLSLLKLSDAERDNSTLRRLHYFKLKFNVACLLHISSLSLDVVINILSGDCFCCCCWFIIACYYFRNLLICCVWFVIHTHQQRYMHIYTMFIHIWISLQHLPRTFSS